MKCSPLFLTSPTVVWFGKNLSDSVVVMAVSLKNSGLNPLSGKESFRRY